MKFEEIIPLLREGKKAFLPDYDRNGESWMAGYIGIKAFSKDEEQKKTLTIHRINNKGGINYGKNDWGIPCWAILDDTWEIK